MIDQSKQKTESEKEKKDVEKDNRLRELEQLVADLTCITLGV